MSGKRASITTIPEDEELTKENPIVADVAAVCTSSLSTTTVPKAVTLMVISSVLKTVEII